MMYNNKLVAVVKVNGSILRESGETVHIPFGSEYEIHFKNLHSTKAVVSIDVDGEDVLDGSRLVVMPNDTNSVEGFLRGNSVSHKFKFIEKTQEISDYRGDKISDGLIRISFQFEEAEIYHYNHWNSGILFSSGPREIKYGSSADDAHFNNDITRSLSASNISVNHVSTTDMSLNDDGITVKGGESDQSFVNTTTRRLLPQVHTIVFQLKGDTNTGKKIEKPILVKTKITCDSCGRRSLSKHKFCGNCGTSLVV